MAMQGDPAVIRLLNTVLTNLPDVWAEKFVDRKGKDFSEFGLKEPEQTLTITKENGVELPLLIGKRGKPEVRHVMKPAPPFVLRNINRTPGMSAISRNGIEPGTRRSFTELADVPIPMPAALGRARRPMSDRDTARGGDPPRHRAWHAPLAARRRRSSSP